MATPGFESGLFGTTETGTNTRPPIVRETHLSVLWFVGDRVYKFLKPVAYPFLDVSTVERRSDELGRELELNRRLASDVYLGVVTLDDDQGRVIDTALVMRRMPEDRRLRDLLRTGEAPTLVHRVGREVARFHASLEALPTDLAEAAASRDAMAKLWQDNWESIDPLVGEVFDRGEVDSAKGMAGQYLAGRDELFRHRIADGFVVDGHGDLLSDDIFCLDDGPRILDCLAFDDRLRHGDVLADVGFLAMDVEQWGEAELARQLFVAYEEFSPEYHPGSLAHHYLAYRAQVRAKIAAIRHQQGDRDAASDARRLLTICREHLQRCCIRLILVGGSPATGKSSVADGLSRAMTAVTIGSDETRKQLAGMSPSADASAGFGEGIYKPEMTDATYQAILDRAGTLLAMGESVVLDASWTKDADRAKARRLAEKYHATIVELQCDTDEPTAVARLVERQEQGAGASDATVEVLRAMRQRMEPWPEARRISTSQSFDTSLASAFVAVDEASCLDTAQPREQNPAIDWKLIWLVSRLRPDVEAGQGRTPR